MAILNFPNAAGQPIDGSFTYEDNGVLYSWDGYKWTANSEQAYDDRYVEVTGDTMTGDLTVPSLNGGQLAGLRNQLINSGFQVDQRGLSGVSLSGTKYCLDRWVAVSGATVTKLNVSVGGLPNCVSYSGGNTAGYLRQAIELPGVGTHNGPFNTSGLDWTFSVYSDAVPKFEAFYADDNSGLANKTNWIDLTDLTSTGKTIRTNATGTLTQYSITFSNSPGPAATNKCLVIAFRGGGFYAGPQFEPGPVATPFEQRPIGLELSLCQRYFFKETVDASYKGYQLNKQSSTVRYAFPEEMRTVPTISALPTGGSSGSPTTGTYATPTTRSVFPKMVTSQDGTVVTTILAGTEFDAEL